MPYKTFSQKAARVFEIVCYVLLIPATGSIIFTLIQASVVVFIPLVITGIGLVLLSGYRRHSRGKLGKDKLSLLWLGTLFFNGTPLIPVFYQIIFNPDRLVRIEFKDFLSFPVLFIFLLVLWWMAAVSFSVTFIIDEINRDARIK